MFIGILSSFSGGQNEIYSAFDSAGTLYHYVSHSAPIQLRRPFLSSRNTINSNAHTQASDAALLLVVVPRVATPENSIAKTAMPEWEMP